MDELGAGLGPGDRGKSRSSIGPVEARGVGGTGPRDLSLGSLEHHRLNSRI